MGGFPMSADIADMKAAMPFPELLSELGVEVRPEPRNESKFTIFSPLRDDGKNASFDVTLDEGGRWLWYDHGIKEGGDEVTFLEHYESLNRKDAIKRYGELAGVGQKNGSRKKIAATFDYTDAEGNLIHQTVRFEPKDFRQRRPDGKGGWAWNLEGIEPLLYKLPDVLAHPSNNRTPIFLVEGEKDCDNVAKFGLTSTTCSMGAGKWRDSYTDALRGRWVCIIGDNDEAGREHVRLVGEALDGAEAKVSVIDLKTVWPAAPEKADISDAIEACICDGADIIDWADAAPEWTPQDGECGSVADNPGLSKKLDVYYDSERKEYLIKNSGGRWLAHTETAFKRWLKSQGISTKPPEGAMLSPADEVILDAQDTKDVRFAGPLSGRWAGFYDEGGVRFLVTESPSIPEPKPGVWKTIEAFLNGLLRDGEEEHGDRQVITVHAWLKVAYEALTGGKSQPGQALAIAGPVGCGKSRLQLFIGECLGGRTAKASLCLLGKSNFNAELFGAEHLMLEDEHMSTAHKDRLALAAQIKSVTVNELQACHRKNRTPVMLKPFWRLTISLNDEPERMLVLPPLDPDIEDKIIILRASNFEFPMPVTTPDEKRAFWDQMLAEIPAFLHYLINWKIPAELIDRRYGVATWHHPELVRDLEELAPKAHLLSMIDQVLWDGELPDEEWIGTAQELRSKLMDDYRTKYDAQKLLSWRNACGSYLRQLEDQYPERLTSVRQAGRGWMKWTIKNPDFLE
jgi:hypothetical protein